nr:MAG TPA: hypothetical protein [Caudoviricetes sp.]
MTVEATVKRGLRRLRELNAQGAAIKEEADRIREWLGKHAPGYTGELDGVLVSITTEHRWSVDNRALREALKSNPALANGLSITYSVPAKLQPTDEQLEFITLKPQPTKVTFKES